MKSPNNTTVSIIMCCGTCSDVVISWLVGWLAGGD